MEILNSAQVDLLISDVIMPNMSGYDLATTILNEFPDIKIQLVSGFNDADVLNCTVPDLRENMLLKPYNSDKLLKRMRELLDS